ncbi:MAG: DUF2244 domain-containing protein [Aquincola sp.]|nr:DUF2244 domain-containing protein [Aquincola sp.]
MPSATHGVQIEWLLKRNCSFSPAQLFGVYLSLCAVSLTIALGFTWQGASPVLAFAGVELLLVGMALLVYARHATDHELLALAGEAFTVTRQRAGQIECTAFRVGKVRVEPVAGDGSLLELSGDGQRLLVGRYLRAELRQPLARELRAVLRQHQEILQSHHSAPT